jgi:hypothetical protein
MLDSVVSNENLSVDTLSPKSLNQGSHVDDNTSILDNIVTKHIIDLFKTYLENNDMKNKIAIPLTPEITSVINNIISLSPNTLIDISVALIEIVNDGKIDMSDIPNIIIVTQKLYQTIYSLRNIKFDRKKITDITSSILKFFIHFLVLERKIMIEQNKQADFLSQIDVLIDSCVGLLSYSKSLKTKRCFKKIF